METKNKLLAFDICKDSVLLIRDICKTLGVPFNKSTFACADVEKVQFSEKFDIISVNNALHHVEDRMAAFQTFGKSLAIGGKLLLVEPNYYYPPRWVIETDIFDPFNPAKRFFLKNGLMEEGEKAVRFSVYKKELKEAGFRIIANEMDPNYLGYFLVYWMKRDSCIAKAIHLIDRLILQWIIPNFFTPFEYIIAEKA